MGGSSSPWIGVVATPAAQAIDFVFRREDAADEPWDDADFDRAFHALDWSTAQLVDRYMTANAALIAVGIPRKEREVALRVVAERLTQQVAADEAPGVTPGPGIDIDAVHRRSN